MSTEPIDFTEDEGLDEVEEISDMGVDRGGRRGGVSRPQQRRAVVEEEERMHVGLVLALSVGFLISISAALVAISASRGHSNSVTRFFAEKLGGAGQQQ